MTRFVFVHGFTQTGASWAPITTRLAGDEMLTPDLPGHGDRSSVRADLGGSADLLVEQCGPACYVGYSLGARVCLHAALRHPDAVERLVVLGATGGIDDDAERAARRERDEQLAAELEASGDVATFVERWLRAPLFATLTPEAAGVAARLANTAGGLASSLRLAGTGTQQPIWDRLATLEMPVLVMAGALDTTFRELAVRLVAAIGANATLALIPAAGHAAHLEQPDAFVALIRETSQSPGPPRT